MRSASVAATLARVWTTIYTIGLPPEIRNRRRQEIASDVWSQQHQEAGHSRASSSAAHVATRVVLGMPADLLWRSAQRRQTRRPALTNIAVDDGWDARMRSISRAAIILLIAFYAPIALGMPVILAITLPGGAFAIHRLQGDTEKARTVTDTAVAHKRKTRTIVVVASIAVFAIGLFVDGLPSEATHDRYWMLFVAPSMIAFIVGVIALPMLVWSYLPRRPRPGGAPSARL